MASQHNPLFDSYKMSGDDQNDAAALIRQKVERMYGDEPNALEELQEAKASKHQSKHQKFMYELGTSGKDLATVQTQWHSYYQNLTDSEKHEVWQEFYSSHDLINKPISDTSDSSNSVVGANIPRKISAARAKKLKDARSVDDVKATIRHNVTAGGKLKAKHHLQSLLFGLGAGAIVLVIVLFGFFNEVVLAPLYQPSRNAQATPIIVDPNSVAPTKDPVLIIPKINLEVPVDYKQTTIDETVLQQGLENGIIHYPITSKPGENGNAAFFGHSSSNIFNKGKFKFAFVLLNALVPGDTFYITYNNKVYVYKVISRTIVDPSNVGVLDPVPGKTATATLITCDPPGTSIRRLVVVGEQISPSPTTNIASTQPSIGPVSAANSPDSLLGNGRTLGGRLFATPGGKLGITVLAIGVVIGGYKRTQQRRKY